jgi:hypothetical protein
MKRDMELIREILIAAEAHDSSNPCLAYEDPSSAYQIALIKEAGLVEAVIRKDENGLPSGAVVVRLTWAGHDFLDSARDSKIWKLAKEHVIKPGMSWSFSILVEWLKQQARQRILRAPSPE